MTAGARPMLRHTENAKENGSDQKGTVIIRLMIVIVVVVVVIVIVMAVVVVMLAVTMLMIMVIVTCGGSSSRQAPFKSRVSPQQYRPGARHLCDNSHFMSTQSGEKTAAGASRDAMPQVAEARGIQRTQREHVATSSGDVVEAMIVRTKNRKAAHGKPAGVCVSGRQNHSRESD
jgi:hypothetical protein